ncbi:Uncharacterised protein [Mycobacteroides abscessus subsp. abscessus]|nr:Uncharacterised protein [Mycobacteroides abscessus subsp. abscessus]
MKIKKIKQLMIFAAFVSIIETGYQAASTLEIKNPPRV